MGIFTIFSWSKKMGALQEVVDEIDSFIREHKRYGFAIVCERDKWRYSLITMEEYIRYNFTHDNRYDAVVVKQVNVSRDLKSMALDINVYIGPKINRRFDQSIDYSPYKNISDFIDAILDGEIVNISRNQIIFFDGLEE